MNRNRFYYMTGKKLAMLILLLLMTVLIIFGLSQIDFWGQSSGSQTSATDTVSLSDVSGTDTPADMPQEYSVDEMPENIIATGVLTVDSAILAQPEDGAAQILPLAVGDIIYIRASDGIWFMVTTITGEEGYIKADLVNTGGFDASIIASLAPMPGHEPSVQKTTTATTVASTSSSATASTSSQSGDKTSTTTATTTAAAVNPEDFPTNSSPYFIYVEKGSHSITIYAKDENGKYTRPIRTYLTATGKTSALTPVGLFQISTKETWHAWGSKSYSPYASTYKSGLFIHGPIYTAKNFGTLKEASVNAIGTNASSGCMRTSAEAAYFIYQFCPRGTYIKIVNGSPLGLYASRPNIDSQYVDPATGRVPVAGVTVSPNNVTVGIGETLTLSAVISPDLASEKACTWLSSNTAIASVNASGKITARSVGVATITCTTVDGGFVGYCTVTVFDPNTTSSSTSTTTSTTASSTESTSTSTSSSSSASTESTTATTESTSAASTSTTTTSSAAESTTTTTTETSTATTAATTTTTAAAASSETSENAQ